MRLGLGLLLGFGVGPVESFAEAGTEAPDTGSATLAAFPGDVSGAVLFLQPQDIAQTSNVITAWPDRSGNGNDAVPTNSPAYAASTLDGYGAYDGSFALRPTARLALPNVFSAMTAGEIFLVLKVGAGSLTNGLMDLGSQSGELFPYVDGNIYEDFGTTARKSCGAPVLSITATHRLYNVRSASGAWSAWLNTTQQFSTATNTVSFTTSPQLGKAAGGNAFTGTIVEFLLFNTVLSSGDRAKVISYYRGKYPTLGL